MYVKFLALLGAPVLCDISRLRVKKRNPPSVYYISLPYEQNWNAVYGFYIA
jgi:hypothetical protein